MTLVRGEMDLPVPTGRTPVEMAEVYIAEGAEWLHVVDLDRVVGEGDNAADIRRILEIGAVPVQVGGGIRTFAQAQELMDGARHGSSSEPARSWSQTFWANSPQPGRGK